MDPESIIREASVAVGAFGWVQKESSSSNLWPKSTKTNSYTFFNEGIMYMHIYSLSYSTFWSWHNRAQYLVKGVSENKIEGFKNNNREMDNAPGPGRQIWARH